ncbi:MAG TPA: glutathione S-transferase [Candidatus Desulfobacillus sp.]|nr:glutathione S-transferase [Candidatus Desulfobacillus sp.]
MKLIGSLTSPYTRKVRVVLAEKKIECEFVEDNPWNAETIVPGLNPLGKVPVLLLDDDSTLFDSRVIVEYLDGMTPNNRLMPASGRQRTRIRRWEALADGMQDAAVAAYLETKRPKNEQSADFIARQKEKIGRALEAVSAELANQPWCSGNAFSLADIAIGCSLDYLDLRLKDIGWRGQHANLLRLHGELMQRPAFAETAPQELVKGAPKPDKP